MQPLAEIVALFTIVSNNFSPGTFSCGLRNALQNNMLLSHAIAFGVLYNLVVKLYNPHLRGWRLLLEVGLVYVGYMLMVLQIPEFVLFDVALMLVLSAIKSYVPDVHSDAFTAVATTLVFAIIVAGILYSIFVHLRRGGTIKTFFMKTSCHHGAGGDGR
tara:strand:+ start:735 stop:1211 length:477 start_codon:yes stop_codon:yes gene_type:complete